MLHPSSTSGAVAAFCQQCPDEPTVRNHLGTLGFSLTFQMEGSPAYPSDNIPALPAQYHYQDAFGTEVIYLAGRDSPPEDGLRYPPHRSRFWVYPGAKSEAYIQAIASVTDHWFVMWFPVQEPQVSTQRQSA
jgi:hypothetical protein